MVILLGFRRLRRLTYLSLFKSKGTHARLTRKRVLFLVGFYAVFVPLQIIHGVFLLLDNVFFPGYRRVDVRQPVFIIGNPRSGSTHLLRVLARDEQTFACAKLWELFLAPSITQRKILRSLAAVDYRLGGPFQSWLVAWQERNFNGLDTYHLVRLDQPDEDELSFTPIFSSLHLVFPFPFWEEFSRQVYFDTKVSASDRDRFMTFYRRSMQRTLYMHGPTKHYLSKTPANSGRVGSLCEAFPDAKFIYTARDPTSGVASTMSLFSYYWSTFSDPSEEYPFRKWVVESSKHWYRYPIRRLQDTPAGSCAIVKHDDLVRDLEQTVTGLYPALGLDISPQYAQALQEEAEEARRFRSKHRYSLEDMGLSEQQIATQYRDVFDCLGFETDWSGDRLEP